MSPLVTDDDISAVSEQMRSFWIGRGERVRALEIAMADWVGVDHAVAFGSGTAALSMAVKLLGRPVRPPDVCCAAVIDAIRFAGLEPTYNDGDARITIYPDRGVDIEDFARHLPKKHEIRLTGRFGVFSFGALKDVSGGLGGCLVSNEPLDGGVLAKVSPLSDINAAMILSQLARYEGKSDRLVAGGMSWRLK